LNLRQLEVFRAVMATGSVTDAARLLHVSVPAASRMLAHAESQLGFHLFERIKGRLHPTSEAKMLYQEVESVWRGVQRLNRLARDLEERRCGVLSIVSSPSIGQMLVPLALARFHERQPSVRVYFENLSFEHLRQRLLDRQSDLGVSILPVDHPQLHSQPIASGRMVCICPPAHALAGRASVSVTELQDHALIGYPAETPFGLVVAGLFDAHGASLRVSMEVGSPQNACALVHAGAGIAVVDEFSLAAWQKATFHVVAIDDAPPVVAELAYLRTEALSPNAQAFLAAMQAVVAQRGLASS